MTQQITITPKAALFDMDGLLLDTEPLWSQSMQRVARQYQIPIESHHFKHTTGLRIYEVTEFWKNHFPWQGKHDPEVVAEAILDDIIASAKDQGKVMPGAESCIDFLKKKGLKIGLATSSPMRMVDALIPHFGLADLFDILVSADAARVGKPHPEVFLQAAEALVVPSWQCFVLEDSINGMVAAKAARMKVVMVPEQERMNNPAFGLADIKLKSLEEFDDTVWRKLTE